MWEYLEHRRNFFGQYIKKMALYSGFVAASTYTVLDYELWEQSSLLITAPFSCVTAAITMCAIAYVESERGLPKLAEPANKYRSLKKQLIGDCISE